MGIPEVPVGVEDWKLSCACYSNPPEYELRNPQVVDGIGWAIRGDAARYMLYAAQTLPAVMAKMDSIAQAKDYCLRKADEAMRERDALTAERNAQQKVIDAARKIDEAHFHDGGANDDFFDAVNNLTHVLDTFDKEMKP